MSKRNKALQKIRQSPKNVRFEEIDSLLLGLGFTKRQRGSHAIYTYPGIERLTVPYKKPFILPVYVKQILKAIELLIAD